jgi:hypothetical protein
MRGRNQATNPRGPMRAVRAATFLVSALMSAAVVAGCGGGSGTAANANASATTRGVSSYCSYFYGEGATLRERFIRASAKDANDPIAGLAGVFADLPEAASFMHGLAQRAPDEIAPQLEVLAKNLEGAVGQAGSAASNPAGSIGSLFASALASGGAEQRINEYTLKHCGPPPGSQKAQQPTPATTASSGALELLACEESQSSNSSSVVALRYENGAMTSSPVASFAKAEKDGCPVSANLAYMAAVEHNAAGNVVAGYVPAGGGPFVNLAGNETRGFSDQAVTDGQPRFDWTTGELWWQSNYALWSASVTAKQPKVQNKSVNVLDGFSLTGRPEEQPWQQSLEGKVEFLQPNGEEYNLTDNEIVVGTLVSGPGLTTACENQPYLGVSSFAEGSGCKGVAAFDVSQNCRTIIGFVSTSQYVCQESNGAGTRFSLATVVGKGAKPSKATPLTPETQQTLKWAEVTPEGKSLWFSTSETGGENGAVEGEAGTAEGTTEATHLYAVSTATYTSNPTPVMGKVELGSEALPIAWRHREKLMALRG